MDPYLRSEIRRLLDSGLTKRAIAEKLGLPDWKVKIEAGHQQSPIDIHLSIGDRVKCRDGRVGRIRRFLRARVIVGDGEKEWVTCTGHLVFFPTRTEISQRAELVREKHLSLRRSEAV